MPPLDDRSSADPDLLADRVLAFLRAGREAQVGGGRSFSVYAIRNGQPVVASSCDGDVDERIVTEEHLRERIEADRALFLDYLRIWER